VCAAAANFVVGFYDGDTFPTLGGLHRGTFSARPCANHDDIEFVFRHC
jgi:hypothetical protein